MLSRYVRSWLFTGVAMFAALSAGCSGKHKGQEQRTHGTIKEVDPTTHVLVIKEKPPGAGTNDVAKVKTTYRVAFDCRISIADKSRADFSDLKVGDRINYRFTIQGKELVIHKITPRGVNASTNSTAKLR